MPATQQRSTTPILDLDAPLPPAKDHPYSALEKVGIVAFFAVGMFVPIYTATYVKTDPDGRWSNDFPFFLALTFLGTPVVWAIITAVHEAGHVLVGLSLGFHLHSLEIGPLRIENNRCGIWRLRSVRPFRILVGGNADMRLNRFFRVRQRLVLLYLGGIATTIPISIASWAAALHASSPIALLLAINTGFVSTIQVIGSIVHVHVGPEWEGANDYTYIRALISSTQNARRIIASHVISMMRERQIDRIQINPRWLRIAYGKEFWDEWISYRTAEAPVMAEKLERRLATSDRYRGDERNALILEAAFFLAWYRNDVCKAHIWLGRAAGYEDESYSRIRAEVALHSASHEFSAVLEYWNRGLTLVQSMSQPWTKSIEQEWLEWRAELEKRENVHGHPVTSVVT